MPLINPKLLPAQMLIGKQIALSVPLQIAFVYFGFHHLPLADSVGPDFAARLTYVLQWELVGVLVLLAMIMFIAGYRPLSEGGIDGSEGDRRINVHQRVQRNTLEQLTLMIFGHLALLTVLPPESLRVIPVLVLLFVVARVVYWVGYVRDPLLRTTGFVATFYPNIAVLLYAAWKIFG